MQRAITEGPEKNWLNLRWAEIDLRGECANVTPEKRGDNNNFTIATAILEEGTMEQLSKIVVELAKNLDSLADIASQSQENHQTWSVGTRYNIYKGEFDPRFPRLT